MRNRIKSLDNNQLNLLLDFIGSQILRTNLIENAKNLHPTSKYYLGKRSGSFWNGFRPEQIPQSKVKMFYTHEFKNDSIDIATILEKSINLRLDVINKDEQNIKNTILSIEDKEVMTLLLYLYEIDNFISIEQFILEKQKIKKDYSSDLKIKNELHQKNLESIEEKYKKELEEERELHKNRLDELCAKIKTLETDNERYKEIEIQIELVENETKNKIIDRTVKNTNIFKDINLIRVKNAISNKDDIRNVLIELMHNNIKLLEDKKDISRLLVIQYIYAKMMEDN